MARTKIVIDQIEDGSVEVYAELSNVVGAARDIGNYLLGKIKIGDNVKVKSGVEPQPEVKVVEKVVEKIVYKNVEHPVAQKVVAPSILEVPKRVVFKKARTK